MSPILCELCGVNCCVNKPYVVLTSPLLWELSIQQSSTLLCVRPTCVDVLKASTQLPADQLNKTGKLGGKNNISDVHPHL